MAADPERRAELTQSAAASPRSDRSAETARAIDRSGVVGRADASPGTLAAPDGRTAGKAAPMPEHPTRNSDPARRSPRPAPVPASAGELSFHGQSQREALDAIRLALAEQHVFVALTGSAGLGKTALLATAVVALPDLPLRIIRVGEPDRASAELAAEIERVALEQAAQLPDGDRHVVLVIDDAHTASPELLRCLTRIAVAGRLNPRSPQVILAGRPELWDRLAAEEFAPLARRIAVRPVLRPLSDEDARGYITHLLDQPRRIAGQTLTEEAEREVLRLAQGGPERIGAIVKGALALADVQTRLPVTFEVIRSAAAALAGRGQERQERGRARRVDVRALALVTVAVVVVVVAGGFVLSSHGWPPERVLAGVLDLAKPAGPRR